MISPGGRFFRSRLEFIEMAFRPYKKPLFRFDGFEFSRHNYF
jgi:hypothetical protein